MTNARYLRRSIGNALEHAAFAIAVFVYRMETTFFPQPTPTPVRAEGSVLCIGAHPDDETGSCGGTLANHAALGDNVTIVIVASGNGSRAAGKTPEEAAKRRAAEMEAAAKHLGATRLLMLRQSDLALDKSALMKALRPIVDDAAVIYTHGPVDFHPDHFVVAAAVAHLARPDQTIRIGETQCLLTPLLINRIHSLDAGAVAARSAAEAAHASQSNTLVTAVRRYRLTAAATKMGAVENFWELDGAAFQRIMAKATWRDNHTSPFRGIRFRAFYDPLAVLCGTRARLALRRAATRPPRDQS